MKREDINKVLELLSRDSDANYEIGVSGSCVELRITSCNHVAIRALMNGGFEPSLENGRLTVII